MYIFGVARSRFDFFPQTPYVHIYRPHVTEVFIAPDIVQKFLAAVYLVWIVHQDFQQIKLFHREIYFFSIQIHTASL